MKKHLFYSVLAIFLGSSLLTLLGVAGVVPIQDKYLEKLIWAFLGQLAAAVISLFRKTDFFSEEGIKRIESIESTVAQTTVREWSSLTENAGITSASGDFIELSVEGYLDELSRLKERPLERDTWLNKIGGKNVRWIGYFSDVSSRDGSKSFQVSLYGKKNSFGSLFFFVADLSQRDIVYSLRKGDTIQVCGVLDVSMKIAPSVSGGKIERLKDA